MTWKSYAHYCAHCGRVGPRSFYQGRRYHKRCLPDEVLRRMRFEARFTSPAHQQLINIANKEGIS